MRESTRMRLLAGEYRQLGFLALAGHLRKEADAALRWCELPIISEPEVQGRGDSAPEYRLVSGKDSWRPE
jgi:hypothetical protein